MKTEPHHRNSRFVLVSIVIRLALGCLFVWSSLPKLFLPHNFLGDVYAYRMVGPVLGMFISLILPWFELLTGICLLGGLLVSGALLSCIGMAVMFLAAVSMALYQGLNISCGCFGASSAVPIGYSTLVRIIIILIASVFAYICELLLAPRYAFSSLSGSRSWSFRQKAVSADMPNPEESVVTGLETNV